VPRRRIDQDALHTRLDAAAGATDRSTGEAIGGYAKAVGSGVGEGVAHTAGLPINLYNLVGDATMGRFPAWLLEKAMHYSITDSATPRFDPLWGVHLGDRECHAVPRIRRAQPFVS
jgi:hypothetical protein